MIDEENQLTIYGKAMPLSALVCPGCGSSYLHHFAVRIFDRAEDNAECSLSIFDMDGYAKVSAINDFVGNPSPRRDGILIDFWCEDCTASNGGRREDEVTYTMAIAQHKGETFVGWVE